MKASLVLGLFLLSLTPQLSGQGLLEQERLRGLPGVMILVELPPDELDRLGLTWESLQALVLENLRRARIPTFDREEAMAVQGSPYLYVSLTA